MVEASTRSEGMILGEASDPEDKYYVRGEDKGKTSARSEAELRRKVAFWAGRADYL